MNSIEFELKEHQAQILEAERLRELEKAKKESGIIKLGRIVYPQIDS